MSKESGSNLSDLLAQERRARLAAERMLDQKSRELFAANRKLSEHSRALSEEVIVKREQARTLQTETETLKGENVQVRADLQRANRQAESAERRLWEALETIQDGFAVYNRNKQLVIANRAYMGMLDELDAFRPGATYADILALLAEEGLVDIGFESPQTWQARMLARWESPTIEPVVIKLWDGRHIKMIDRKAHGGDMACLALDITETIRYEEQLKEQRSRAEAANRAKSAFLANMSHEIRTPLTSIIGFAETIGERGMNISSAPSDDEDVLHFANLIERSGRRLLDTLNSVLDFSQLEAGSMEVAPEYLDVQEEVSETVSLLRPRAEAVEAAMEGDEARARRLLADEFASVCDTEEPAHNPVSESGRTSYCHRHLDEHEEPEPVFDRVIGRTTGGSGTSAASADD